MSGISFSPDDQTFDPAKYTAQSEKMTTKELAEINSAKESNDFESEQSEELYNPSEKFNNYETSWLQFVKKVFPREADSNSIEQKFMVASRISGN